MDIAAEVKEHMPVPTKEPVLTKVGGQRAKIALDDIFFGVTDNFIVGNLQTQHGVNSDDETRLDVLCEIIFLLADQSDIPSTDSFSKKDKRR